MEHKEPEVQSGAYAEAYSEGYAEAYAESYARGYATAYRAAYAKEAIIGVLLVVLQSSLWYVDILLPSWCLRRGRHPIFLLSSLLPVQMIQLLHVDRVLYFLPTLLILIIRFEINKVFVALFTLLVAGMGALYLLLEKRKAIREKAAREIAAQEKFGRCLTLANVLLKEKGFFHNLVSFTSVTQTSRLLTTCTELYTAEEKSFFKNCQRCAT